jgi:hypothetical protein
MRYRDLPVVPLVPQPYRRLAVPAGAQFFQLSISVGGEVYWCSQTDLTSSAIFDESNRQVALRPPSRDHFLFPNVQRFPDGRWLVVEPRALPKDENAHVFAANGDHVRSFFAGDGIQIALIDSRSRVWIGYFDEGIFGAFNPRPPQGDRSYDYGPSGLVRLDDRGGIEFAYNRRFPDRSISDIYALTLDDDGRAWFCPYTDFFLASVTDDPVDFVLPRAPTEGASALSIGPDYFAFFGGFRRSSMVAVVNRKSLRLRLVQLRNPDGTTLSPPLIATRGARAIAVAQNRLFGLDQEILLGALGPWTDENSSTLDSAVQYLDEENSYAGYTILYPNGPTQVAGPPRPTGNPPRHDENTGQ